MDKKKFEVSVEIDSARGYQTYGIEADSKEDALANFYNGEIIREEIELDFCGRFGDANEPIVEEVEDFNHGYEQELSVKTKYRHELFEKILREHVVLSELRDIYRKQWLECK